MADPKCPNGHPVSVETLLTGHRIAQTTSRCLTCGWVRTDTPTPPSTST